MNATLTMALVIVGTLYIMIPPKWRRRVFGYYFIADIIGSAYVVGTFATTGAVSGLAIAVWSALGITLALRLGLAMLGGEQLAVDGDTSFSALIAAGLSQGVKWVRGTVAALWNGGTVQAPEPRNWSWVETHEANGFFRGIKVFAQSIFGAPRGQEVAA